MLLMKARRLLITVSFFAASLLPPAEAIIIRPDRNEDSYTANAKGYPAVGLILPNRGFATLLADQWAITSADAAQSIPEGQGEIDFHGKKYQIQKSVIHPNWKDTEANRIALLKLTKPVKGIEPLSIYSGASEVGLVAVLLGFGPPGVKDITKWAATNKIEEASPDWIFFRFDQPSDATELEGINAPYDLGGPAIIEVRGTRFLAGMNVTTPSGNYPSEYGAYISYARLSSCYDWIVDTIRSSMLTE